MITALRWEICALVEPWAAPHSTLVGPPILSGSVTRDSGNADPLPESFFAASDVICVPAATLGETNFILALETFGSRGWLVSFGTINAPPQATDGLAPLIDPRPCVLVPPSGMQGTGRSREYRAVRPLSVFICQPSRT